MSYLITNFPLILLRFNNYRCQELGLEYLHPRRWMECLCLFYKVLSNKVLKYVYELILSSRDSSRNLNLFTDFPCRTEHSKNSIFLVAINDWNKLDPKIRDSTSYLSFRNALIEITCQPLMQTQIKAQFWGHFNRIGPWSIKPVTKNNHAFFSVLPFLQYYSSKSYEWDFPTENDEKLLDIYYTVTVNLIQ